MFTSCLLYHAFGVKGYHQWAIHFEEVAVIVRVRPLVGKLCCSGCGSVEVLAKGAVDRLRAYESGRIRRQR